MPFVKHTWTDDLPPALCAEELNRIEDGIEEAIAGGGAPTDASFVVVDAEAGLSAEYPLGTTIIMRGVAGSKPAASKAGLIYVETDGSYIVWRDNGAGWDEIARGETGIRLAQLAERAHSSTTGRTTDDHHAEAHAAEHQNGGAQEISVAALSGLLADDQHVLDAEVLAVAAALVHKNRHKSGGADELTSTDLLEAIVKRIQESGGPTTLTVGAVADDEYVKRSGATLIGGTPAGAGSDVAGCHGASYPINNQTINDGNTYTSVDLRDGTVVPSDAVGLWMMLLGKSDSTGGNLGIDSADNTPDSYSSRIKSPVVNIHHSGLVMVRLGTGGNAGKVKIKAILGNWTDVYGWPVGWWR